MKTTHRLAGYRITVESVSPEDGLSWLDRPGTRGWDCTVRDGRKLLGTWYVAAADEAHAAGEALALATEAR